MTTKKIDDEIDSKNNNTKKIPSVHLNIISKCKTLKEKINIMTGVYILVKVLR